MSRRLCETWVSVTAHIKDRRAPKKKTSPGQARGKSELSPFRGDTKTMQFAKDTFYMALRTRLSALDPARTVSLDGVSMPAILVTENSLDCSEKPLPETYYLTWGACRPLSKHNTRRPLLAIDCSISYWTAGTNEAGVDRGRVLGQLDTELIAICHPLSTAKLDYTQSPSLDLGTNIFWTAPLLNQVEFGDIARDQSKAPSRSLRRTAALTIFFFPEADLS